MTADELRETLAKEVARFERGEWTQFAFVTLNIDGSVSVINEREAGNPAPLIGAVEIAKAMLIAVSHDGATAT